MSSAAHPAPRRLVLAELLPGALVRDVALVLGAALLTAACAWIVVPLPFSPVPVTGQTFAELLTAAALGPARGTAAQLLYVALGVAGLPFFQDGTSGPDVLFGVTGGYLVGFVLAAWVVGAAARRGLDRSARAALPAFLLGSLVIYAVGVPWLAVVAGLGPGEALAKGLLPFIPGGIAKALLAAGLLPFAWRLSGRR